MALNTSPDNLYREVNAAILLRDQQLKHFDELVGLFTGPGIVAGKPGYWSENHIYEWLSLNLPKLIYDNPRVKVTSRRATPEETIDRIDDETEMIQQGMQEGMVDPNEASFMLQQLAIIRNKLTAHNTIAKAMKHGLNRWIKDTNGRDKLLQVAYDMAMGHGVMMTTRTPVPGSDPGESEPQYWPQWQRISPRRFGFDPLCLWYGGARYAFHLNVDDIEDLKARPDDEGWNKGLLHDLGGNEGIEDARKHIRLEDKPDRGEVAYYEVWVPEEHLPNSPGPDEGFNGTIHTIVSVEARSDEELRKPRPYYGPRTGPYTMFGTYIIPDSPYPLSPLMAVYEQAKELNEQASAITKMSRDYKKMVIVDSTEKILQKVMAEGKNNGVYMVPGFDKSKIAEVEALGPTKELLAQFEMKYDRLNRVSGLSDTERGNIQSDVTATAEAIASESGATRMAFVKQQFGDATQSAIETAAWFLYHDDEVEFPLGQEAGNDLRMIEPIFRGGSHDPESGARYEDIELELEVYSMGRVSEQMLQKRMMDKFQILTGIVPIMAQAPHIDWRLLFEGVGDAMNEPDFGDLVDEDMLEKVTQMQMASQQQGDPMLQKQASGGKEPEKSNTKRTGPPTSGEQQGRQQGIARSTA